MVNDGDHELKFEEMTDQRTIECARWPIEEIQAQLNRGQALVRDLGMEGFCYLIHQVIEITPDLKDRPMIAIAPTEEEALRLGQNLRAILGGGGPQIGDRRRAVYIWDEPASPYESVRASRRFQGERLAVLSALSQGRAASIHALSVMGFARRVVPQQHLKSRTLRLVVGEDIDRDHVIQTLVAEGYERVNLVHEPCSFLVRGDRLDVFSPHLTSPLRISFFGDEVESICTFQPENQRRNSASLPEITLPPLREAPLTPDYASLCGDGIIDLADELFETRPELEKVGISPTHPLILKLADQLTEGDHVTDLEALLPAFFLDGLSRLDLFIEETLATPWFVIWDRTRVLSLLDERLKQWMQVHEEGLKRGRLTSPPEGHAMSVAELIEVWSQRTCLFAAPYELAEHALSVYLPAHLPLRQSLDRHRGGDDPLEPLIEALDVWSQAGQRIGIVCQTRAQRDQLSRRMGARANIFSHSLTEWLKSCDLGRSGGRGDELSAGIYLLRGSLSAGFHQQNAQITLVSAAEIFNTPLSSRRQVKGKRGIDLNLDALLSHGTLQYRRVDGAETEERDPWDNESVDGLSLFEEAEEEVVESPFINSLSDLNVGDPIVHLDYGIGLFQGLVQVEDQGSIIDFVHLEFAKKETVLLPVYRLHLIQKFIGSRSPKLTKKGGADWHKALNDAKTSAEDQAKTLIELYAERARVKGFEFSTPAEAYAEFEARFPYTATRDQLRSIQKIIKEMCAPQPMDHLLCGDVGFGKTEVAMRAAMKAVIDGKQVVILVPTTILASQHTKSFAERFAYTPYVVAQLSRFVSPERRREVKDGLRKKEIHIVVGTHSVLHESVHIPDLGLLILDEEHRFGVKDKERFKQLRAQLDVLSMTATPIPRTLHMSLSGLRSMSVIATPPRDRLSVMTRMIRLSDAAVREAILFELKRGGQVYFVHNRVESIKTRQRWLSAIVPEVTIAIAHGKMKPTELENVMCDFTEGAFNLLLCTTLIENGIDIPRANTIIIDDADTFGLSQLYQLRGRVGRSHERGRCLLLISPEAGLSPEARARLSAIQKFTELGSGFHIASQDLELRGAGELLGTQQKGHVQRIGLDLYGRLLSQAVLDLQEGPRPQRFSPQIQLGKRARGTIPVDYIDDIQERLRIYRRVSNFEHQDQIPLLFEELTDRFGSPPPEMSAYLNFQRVVLMAKSLGLHEVVIENKRLIITLHPDSPLPLKVINSVLSLPESPFVRGGDDQLIAPLSSSQRQTPERSTVAVLLYLVDRAPQAKTMLPNSL